MRYLTFTEIVRLNKLTVTRHGGHFVPPNNFLHEEALHYLVETVTAEMFGQPLYPTLADKGGLYLFNIISNHIFQDGNKRTGLAAALTFAYGNGFELSTKLDRLVEGNRKIPGEGNTEKEILYQFTIEVASGKVTLEQCQKWFSLNLVSITPTDSTQIG